MDLRVLDFAFAVILFIAAYYVFDWYDPTLLAISSILALTGVNSLLMNSGSAARRDLGRSCQRLALIITVFLLFKILIFG